MIEIPMMINVEFYVSDAEYLTALNGAFKVLELPTLKLSNTQKILICRYLIGLYEERQAILNGSKSPTNQS